MKTFALGTNQVENETKREKLPVGNFTKKRIEDLPGRSENYTKQGEWLISLGIPLGNGFSEFAFWKSLYEKAKSHLCKVSHLNAMSIVGRHRILNANFYGRFRYWLWSLELNKEVDSWITSDAKSFLWTKNPEMEPTEKGSSKRIGKWINPAATPLPIKKGGGGVMNWKMHCASFPAMWVFKLISPREALWRVLVQGWLREGNFRCTDIFQNLSKARKKKLLLCIPKSANYLRLGLINFWDLKLRTNIDWQKIRPEEAEAQPLFENHAFTLSTNSAVHDFWRGAKFENLGDILTAQRTILSKREIKQKLANSHLGLSSASIDYRANQLDKLVKKIPPLIIGAVSSPGGWIRPLLQVTELGLFVDGHHLPATLPALQA